MLTLNLGRELMACWALSWSLMNHQRVWRDVPLLAQCWPGIHEAMGSIPSTI